MYRYDAIDRALVKQRVDEFRDQTLRYLAGQLAEDEFRQLRLRNGLYVQRHAPMLRVAIPYGTLSSRQLRTLAAIAREFDRGWAHLSTRQNLQFNWVRLEQVPEILERLAEVEMHAIQTSGNCVRNISCDEFAGVAPDELVDPRALAEILRQWSSLHPEFNFLPRKFKIAISGAREDRAALAFHDIGLQVHRSDQGALRIRVWVGGGLGRTPVVGQVLRDDLPWDELLAYVEAILRVYNRHGRRDNAYKARIKILIKALGLAEFARQVEDEVRLGGGARIPRTELDRVSSYFVSAASSDQAQAAAEELEFARVSAAEPGLRRWAARNLKRHRLAAWRSVVLSTKQPGVAPGDLSAEQMELVADWAERFGLREIRFTHEQNLVLPEVPLRHLAALWREARDAGLATPNIGLVSDIIACPGGDFCALANAKSIPIAAAIQARLDDLDYQFEIGELNLNISGCMNSCGHHHVGHIGILGVDKDGAEFYQVSLGGADGSAAGRGQLGVGKIIGPAFAAEEVAEVVARLIEVYLEQREGDERFVELVARLGVEPFRERVYAQRRPAAEGDV